LLLHFIFDFRLLFIFIGLYNVSKIVKIHFCRVNTFFFSLLTKQCAQGRAAWLERGRRCSVQDNQASCHRRWVKRNRVSKSTVNFEKKKTKTYILIKFSTYRETKSLSPEGTERTENSMRTVRTESPMQTVHNASPISSVQMTPKSSTCNISVFMVKETELKE
jgi:hypothetical protein